MLAQMIQEYFKLHPPIPTDIAVIGDTSAYEVGDTLFFTTYDQGIFWQILARLFNVTPPSNMQGCRVKAIIGKSQMILEEIKCSNVA